MSSSLPEARSRQQRSARTRDRVLEAATELMARRGYSGTTISAISDASGVMPASIYWHFESKEGLLGAVIERAAQAWFRGAAEAMAAQQAEAGVEASRGAGLRYLFEGQPTFYRVLLLISLERRDAGGPPLEAVQRVRERCRASMARQVEERIEIDDPALRELLAQRLASFGMLLLDGAFMAHQIDGHEGEPLPARYEQLAWAMRIARESLVEEARRASGEGA
jgi:AcrR family transcriptional regulator